MSLQMFQKSRYLPVARRDQRQLLAIHIFGEL
jgi:hypothetical protein